MDASLVNIVAIGIILSAPWLPLSYSFVENPIVRLLLVVSLLAAIRLGPLPGLLMLLAVVTLLVERNQYVLTNLTYQIDNSSMPAVGTDRIFKATSDIPEGNSVDYTPIQKDEPKFLDNNPRLSEGPNNQDAVGFFKEKGLA